MDLNEAVLKAIKTYWNNERDYNALQTNQGDRKYTKKYFNSVANETLPAKDVKKGEKYVSKELKTNGK